MADADADGLACGCVAGWQHAQVWGLHRFYSLAIPIRILEPAQCDEMEHALDTCLACYKALRVEADDAGNRRAAWRLRPKWHLSQHLVHDFVSPARLAPSMFMCYRNESFMGVIHRLLRNGHKRTLAEKALERFQLLCTVSNWRVADFEAEMGLVGAGEPAWD